jgi:hypothetical protein
LRNRCPGFSEIGVRDLVKPAALEEKAEETPSGEVRRDEHR